jgi:hypothetical protein
MKTKAICFGVLAIVIVVGFASISMDSGQIKALSDTQLLELRGGVILCDAGCEAGFCKCDTHDCEDMECSPCADLPTGTPYYCKGKDGDEDADVTDCWKSNSVEDSCTPGASYQTECRVDLYAETDTGCLEEPVEENLFYNGSDCT